MAAHPLSQQQTALALGRWPTKLPEASEQSSTSVQRDPMTRRRVRINPEMLALQDAWITKIMPGL